MPTSTRRAAVVIVPHLDGRVLAVSRGADLRYALPGGHVEPGESYEQAARRELFEETGLVAGALKRVFADRRGDSYVAAFVALDAPHGELRSSPEGWSRWVDPRVLTGRGAAFPEYAREALQAAGRLFYPLP